MPTGSQFRRAVNQREMLRIHELRHNGGGAPLGYSEIGRRLRRPPATVFTAYKRFLANGRQFVDGNLRKGHYPRGKLVGAVKDFLLSRETLQEWSGFSLQHRCYMLQHRHHVAVDPSTLMRFYKRNGVKYYSLAYKYQQAF